MKRIHEVSELVGISVRTLHYYDEIGLLVPAETNEVGYRLYDNSNFEKLEQILFFKEIGFPLKQIKKILEHPEFNQKEALFNQKEILKMQKERLEKLIEIIEERLKGNQEMNFKVFDSKHIEAEEKKYQKEVEARWGKSEAYKESAKKTSQYKKEDWNRIMGDGGEIFKEFALHRGEDVACDEVQELVKKWQNHITQNFYHCTKEILAGLGQMYVLDERFTKNINQYGEGLAEYMSEAIAYYCKE